MTHAYFGQKRHLPYRQLGPVVRSPEAARAGGTSNGLSISLLERFIARNQAQVAELMAQGLAPATGNNSSHHSLHALTSVGQVHCSGDSMADLPASMSCSPSTEAPQLLHPSMSNPSYTVPGCVLQLLILSALMIFGV